MEIIEKYSNIDEKQNEVNQIQQWIDEDNNGKLDQAEFTSLV